MLRAATVPPLAAAGRLASRALTMLLPRAALSDVPCDRWPSPKLTEKSGLDLVNDSLLNKGTGFPHPERDRLALRGLIPPRQLSIDVQAMSALHNLRLEATDLEKAIFLQGLQDRNETLFFKLLIDNIAELAPFVYTPTVGKMCMEFASRFRRTRGMYFSSKDRGQMAVMAHNWPHDEVDAIVVTDGSRILGLGDLGANGMGIPIGKLSLYVSCAGFDPARVLPVMLDVGTNNKDLLDDPFYLGMKHRRLEGSDYYSLVDEFMVAVSRRWPEALVQFEDFSSDKASVVLNKYRTRYRCFNDDIQGTGAVTLAGIMGALRAGGSSADELWKQRIVVVGAGSAGLGVADTMRQGMVYQGASEEDARDSFWVVDADGLLGVERPSLTAEQQAFARKDLPDAMPLMDLLKEVKPTVLLGLSGCHGIFTEPLVREFGKHSKRPILFPLSNPTSKAECTAEDAYRWTDGRAIFASGSPFGEVELDGRVLRPTQCNNMYIFPGLALGTVLAGASIVTDRMLYESSIALASTVGEADLAAGKVFPDVDNIRDVTCDVAAAVMQSALEEGLATAPIEDITDLRSYVAECMWQPQYQPLVPLT